MGLAVAHRHCLVGSLLCAVFAMLAACSPPHASVPYTTGHALAAPAAAAADILAESSVGAYPAIPLPVQVLLLKMHSVT